MASSVEIEGKNVEQAIEKASARLDIEKENLTYEILSYGSSGIFGLGKSRNARIRVRLTNDKPSTASQDSVDAAAEAKNDVQALIEETLAPADPGDSLDEPLHKGKRVLQKIVDAITADAVVTVAANHNEVTYRVDGGNAAVIIGKQGQTLEAIQTIIDKVVNIPSDDRRRVQIDVAGYLEQRKATLQKQAERMADKCRRAGKPVTLGYMNAHDRRIVHLALKSHSAVRTQSIGDGPQRKLMIYPKKSAGARRKRPTNA